MVKCCRCLSPAIHRLDRLTSGLLMFAKTVKKAQQLEVEIRERRVTKIYVCRVKGEFPGYGAYKCVNVYAGFHLAEEMPLPNNSPQ